MIQTVAGKLLTLVFKVLLWFTELDLVFRLPDIFSTSNKRNTQY